MSRKNDRKRRKKQRRGTTATHKEPERIIIIGAIQCDGWLYRSETAEEVKTKIDEAKGYPQSAAAEPAYRRRSARCKE